MALQHAHGMQVCPQCPSRSRSLGFQHPGTLVADHLQNHVSRLHPHVAIEALWTEIRQVAGQFMDRAHVDKAVPYITQQERADLPPQAPDPAAAG